MEPTDSPKTTGTLCLPKEYDKDGSIDPLAKVLGFKRCDKPDLVAAPPRSIPFNLDELSVTKAGAILFFGWIDDRSDKLEAIEYSTMSGRQSFRQTDFAREFRPDLASIADVTQDVKLGFWYFTSAEQSFELPVSRLVEVRFRLLSGKTLLQTVRARVLNQAAFHNILSRYAADPEQFVEPSISESASRRNASAYLRGMVGVVADPATSDRINISRFDLTGPTIDNQILLNCPPTHVGGPATSNDVRCGVDTVFACVNGAVFVVGWVDDTRVPLDSLRVLGPGWECFATATTIGRARRTDVESTLNITEPNHFGLWSLMTGKGPIALNQALMIEFTFADGNARTAGVENARIVSAQDLRDITLAYFAGCTYYGSPFVEAQRQLDFGLGARLAAFGFAVSQQLAANPYVLRFHSSANQPRASLVVCLFGRPEFLFLQASAFSRLARFSSEYEFIYVSNSPELAEILSNEAQIAHAIHGVDITLVMLAGNTGFGIANNIGVKYCRTGRILVVNPDVFPMTSNWAQSHFDLIGERPSGQTTIFGVPLYYDDGSLMHAGMYFEMDTGLSNTPTGITGRPMVRVEHYAKGAPANTGYYLASRPVPAVTGAFISLDRAWFEKLDGFTEDYVFGHYEDADLSLKSFVRGVPVWLHDAGLRHLEGKGSVRHAAHEGGAIINRWLFARRWHDTILNGLRGPEPDRLATPVGDVGQSTGFLRVGQALAVSETGSSANALSGPTASSLGTVSGSNHGHTKARGLKKKVQLVSEPR